MSKPTKIILDKQSDLILTNANIVGATGIVKSDLPGLVSDLANLDTAIQTEATERSIAVQAEAATRAAEIATERLRINAILDGSDINLNQFREVVAFVQSIDLENDADLLAKVTEINGKITAEELARISADSALSADLATLQSYVDTTVNSAISQLTSDLADLQSYVDTTVDSAITSLTSDLDAETTARIADVDAEETRALAAEGVLQSNINTEANERVAEDITLQGNIDIESTRAQSAETTIATDLGTETAARIASVSAEEARATAAESVLTSDLSSEVSRATVAEGVLQSNINTEKSRIDSILLASDADKDSFAEIVTLINSVDTTNDTVFAGYVLSNDAALASEISRAEYAESQLTSDLSSEISRANAAEAALTSALTSEVSRATAAESTLTSALSAEEASRIAGDSALQASLNNEIADRVAAGQSTQAALDNESTRAIAAESKLTSDLSSEVSRATAAEGVLTSNLATEVSRATAAESALTSDLSAEVSRAIAAESALTSDLSAEVSRATAAESKLTSDLGTETAARISAVSAEEARATAAEGLLQSNIDTQAGRIDAILDGSDVDLDQFAEVVAFVQSIDMTNDDALLTAITNINAEISDEEAARIAADDQLTSDLENLQSYVDTTVDSAISTLTSDLADETSARIADVDAEESRAIAAEAALQAAIDAEVVARISADETLDGKIADIISNTNAPIIDSFTEVVDNLDAEIARANAAEAALNDAIAQEVSDRTAAIEASNVDLTNETSLRIAGDQNLQAEIDLLPLTDGDTIEVDLVNNYIRLKEVVSAPDSGVRTFEGDIKVGAQPDTKGSYNDLSLITKGILDNRISSEVSNINTSISDEVSRAQNAEGVLQSNIDTEKGRIDAILLAADADADNFAEIVQLINSVDTTNDEAFASYVLSNNQRLTIEEEERLRLTDLLGDGLVGEQIAREDADAVLQHELDVLPTTDGESIELNPVNNTIRLKEVVDAPASGYRILNGDIKTDAQPDTKESFNDLSFVTKGWVDNKVGTDLTSALQAEEDARTQSDAALQANIESTIAEEVINRNTALQQGDSVIQAEIDLLPLTDGDTIEVDLVNNYVRLKEVVSAPDSGVRTFEGDIKVGAQPDTKGSYNDLSLITKGIMDSRLQQEVGTINSSISDEITRAQNAESQLQSNIDTERNRIDAILDAADANADNFAEIVQLINSVDTTNDEVFASYVLSNNQRLTIEEEERLRLTNLLGDSVLNEQIAREDADAVLQHELDILPMTDGESIEVNPVDNTIRLKDVIDAPDSGYRTFKGDVKAQSQPETNESFNDLSFVTKGWVDNKITNDLTSAIETEEADRIAADTTLNGLIDNEVADRIAADNQLGIELTSETERAMNAELDLQNSLNNEIQDRIADVNIEEARAMAAEAGLQAAIDAESAARIAADTDLDSRIVNIVSNTNAPIIDSFTEVVDALNAEIARAESAESDETAARIAGDSQLSTDLSNLQSYVDTTVNSAISTLTSDLSNETAARIADVDAEQDRAIAAEGVLQTNIDTEANERVAEDITLQGNIDIESTRAQAAETEIAADLGTETAARIAAVSAEEARATAAEFGLTSDLSAEVSRATAAEGVLQSNINTEKSRIDSILLASDADKDSFAEIVSLINSVDTTNDTVFAGYVLSNDAALAAEAARATAAEGVLTSDLSTEAARAIAAESVLTSALSAEESSRIAADSALQASLNNEIADRVAAGQSAQAALDTESARAIAAESQLSSDLVDLQSYVDTTVDSAIYTLTSDLSAETTARIDADTLLQSNIDTEKFRIDAILIGASASADNFAEIVTLINSVDTTNDQVFAGYVLSNDAALAAEVSRATVAESALSAAMSAAMSAEVAARNAAELVLTNNLSSEESARIAGDIALSATFSAAMSAEVAARIADVDAEEARATAAELVLTNNLSSEESARIAGDVALSATFSAALSTETFRATAAEIQLSNDLSDEVSYRIDADTLLQSNIDTEKFRIDAILIGASASADNFAEIVTLINSVDTTNDQVFAGYVLSNDAALASEISRATTKESYLEAALSGEINGRVAGDAALSATFSAAMTAEVAARIAADAQLSADLSNLQSYVDTTVDSAIATLTSDLDAETTARIADVDAEETRALAAEGVLQSNINTEANERVAEDITLQGNIDIESTRAQAAETAIAADLGTEIAARIAAVSAEESRATTAESVLTSDLATEVSRATAAEGVLQSNINTEKSRIDAILIGASASADNFAEIVTLINSVDTTNDTVFAGYVLSNDAALATESARATAAEGVLTSDLATEVSRATAAESALTSDLSTESARAIAAESTLTSALSAEESSRIAGDASLQSSLNNEIADRVAAGQSAQAALDTESARAIAAEGVLTSDLSFEVSRAIAAEATLSATFSAALSAETFRATTAEIQLSNDLSDEVSYRIDADTLLQSNIDVEKGRIDSILLASDADKDSFAEIVQLINSVDTTNDQAFASYVLSNDAALVSEVSRATAAESALSATFSAAMSAEVASRIADVDAEESRAIAAELVLTSNLSDEVAARISAVSAEAARATAAELVLTTDFANIYCKKVAVSGTPNGVLTTFTLALPVRIGSEMISINGLLMEEGEDYTTTITNGKVSSIVLFEAPSTGMRVSAYGVCGI